ncbi:hypothetical protein PVAP13_9NG483314 [Panicum virgatum]|uniref:Uncharacterized protein n=1 Tax=Panicum virgatum TaxID=38727 RepID=A0A8T0MVS6_PANVG|nr:hypothetical protein PVAP13_9NG483314 [Panicum virgatum]
MAAERARNSGPGGLRRRGDHGVWWRRHVAGSEARRRRMRGEATLLCRPAASSSLPAPAPARRPRPPPSPPAAASYLPLRLGSSRRPFLALRRPWRGGDLELWPPPAAGGHGSGGRCTGVGGGGRAPVSSSSFPACSPPLRRPRLLGGAWWSGGGRRRRARFAKADVLLCNTFNLEPSILTPHSAATSSTRSARAERQRPLLPRHGRAGLRRPPSPWPAAARQAQFAQGPAAASSGGAAAAWLGSCARREWSQGGAGAAIASARYCA